MSVAVVQGTMTGFLWGLVYGAALGFLLGFNVAWRWLINLRDPLGDGVRAQIKRVRDHRKFAGSDVKLTSYATVVTADGQEYEIEVKQDATA